MSYWGEIKLEEHFKSLDLEDTYIPYLPDFAGREDFDVAPTAIVVVSQRYDVVEVQD